MTAQLVNMLSLIDLSTPGFRVVDRVVFDDRPTDAWKPPIDDPQTRQADFSGLWRMTLTGRADVALEHERSLEKAAEGERRRERQRALERHLRPLPRRLRLGWLHLGQGRVGGKLVRCG